MSSAIEPPAYDDAVAPAVERVPIATSSNTNQAASNPLSHAQTAGSIPSPRPRAQRHSSQPLPAYTRSRVDDPNYINMLEQWAETKKYTQPGQDGTWTVTGWGTRGVASVTRTGSSAVDEREARKRREREQQERERLESVRNRWRVEEGRDDGQEDPVVPAQRRGSRIGNALRRLSSRS